MTTKTRILQNLASATGLFLFASGAFAQSLPAPTPDTSEWRFTGVTGEFVDSYAGPGELLFVDGPTGSTSQVDVFTTCSVAGVPLIGGADDEILAFAAHDPAQGYYLRPLMQSGVGDGPHQWTMVLDFLIPVSEAGIPYSGIWNGSGTNSNDAEQHWRPDTGGFYVNCGAGGSVAAGSWALDTWYRMVVVNDYDLDSYEIFLDGVSVWAGCSPDYLWNGDPGAESSWFLCDNTGETSIGYVANLALTDALLTPSDVAALGSASAGGVFSYGGAGTAYCPGDGTGTLCPCANNSNGSTGGGCDWGNVTFPGGGLLDANGSASIAANDLYLEATAIENNFGIFFGANNAVNGGNGNPLNDGLRCAGGGLVRLNPPTMASGNQATTPQPVQTLDTAAAAGLTRRYQYWFRTPSGPCGTSANLTNGYEIVWTP